MNWKIKLPRMSARDVLHSKLFWIAFLLMSTLPLVSHYMIGVCLKIVGGDIQLQRCPQILWKLVKLIRYDLFLQPIEITKHALGVYNNSIIFLSLYFIVCVLYAAILAIIITWASSFEKLRYRFLLWFFTLVLHISVVVIFYGGSSLDVFI